MSFKVVRTNRKTISLSINAEGELIIRAPLKTPDDYIEDLVALKEGWIKQTQKKVKQRNKLYPPITCQEGEWLPYLGQHYQLEYSEYAQEIMAVDNRLLIPAKMKDVKASVVDWYKQQAKAVIGQRLELHARQLGLEYKSMRITSATRRWGSCSTKRTINFSWRLVMCPQEVIDYVVVHELCHLKQHNHSPAFWQAVEEIVPDYQVQRTWLADNQRLMDLL